MQEKQLNTTADSTLFTRDFGLIFVAHVFFGFSFWPYVLLPVFLQDLGSSLSEVGLIIGAASVSGILIRPWIAAGLQRFGPRRCLMSGGLIFFATHLIYLSIDSMSWIVYAARLLHGLSMGVLFSTFFTMAADMVPEGRRTEGIALFGIGGHLSGAFGVPLGEWLVHTGGYALLFKSSAVFSLGFTLIAYALKKTEHTDNKTPFSLGNFVSLVGKPENRIPLLGTSFFAAGLISYMAFLKPYAHENGFIVTSFFMAYSTGAIVIRLVGGKWPDRFGLKTVLYPSYISLGLGIALLAIWPSPLGLLVSGLLCGFGHGFIFPILSVLLINRAPAGEHGSRMALFTLFFDVGLLFGSPLWGMLAEKQGYRMMFAVSSLSAVIGVFSFIFLDQREKPLETVNVS